MKFESLRNSILKLYLALVRLFTKSNHLNLSSATVEFALIFIVLPDDPRAQPHPFTT